MWPSILFISTSSLVSTSAILLPTSFTSFPRVDSKLAILFNSCLSIARQLLDPNPGFLHALSHSSQNHQRSGPFSATSASYTLMLRFKQSAYFQLSFFWHLSQWSALPIAMVGDTKLGVFLIRLRRCYLAFNHIFCGFYWVLHWLLHSIIRKCTPLSTNLSRWIAKWYTQVKELGWQMAA